MDAKGKIVDIQTMEPCEKEPCEVYVSIEKAKYALEVNAGFVEENEIEVGDDFEWLN